MIINYHYILQKKIIFDVNYTNSLCVIQTSRSICLITLVNTNSVDYNESLSPEEIILNIERLEKDVENLFTERNLKKKNPVS